MKRFFAMILLAASAILLVAGCYTVQPADDKDAGDGVDGDTDADVDGDSDTDGDTDGDGDTDVDGDSDGDADVIPEFEGVDLLIVVDNSSSMSEEQHILATQFFNLINALAFPTPDRKFNAVDDIRVAVVSSDMGLQYQGCDIESDVEISADYMAMFQCKPLGDNGQFRTYQAGRTINIQPGQIRCDKGNAQCPNPPGGPWTCDNIDPDTRVGACQPAGNGDGSKQACPSMPAVYAESTPDTANPDLAFQVACMAQLGTAGCGFEQQLSAAAKGLTLNAKDFIRQNTLVAVLVISDEEDCSMHDGPGLFDTPEISDPPAPGEPRKVNIACGENPQFLFPAEYFKAAFQQVRGSQSGVVFAAIVGVPARDTCQGRGNELKECLSDPDMANTPIVEVTRYGTQVVVNKPACSRMDGSEEVTKARPGIRYVQLAQAFGDMGYVYSICNADWTPAMGEIADLIAERIKGAADAGK